MVEPKRTVIGPEVYRERRNKIRHCAGDGIILWLGHVLQPRNYADNTYPFRQNSHLLYYAGLPEPDWAMLSYPEQDHDILFCKPTTMDDVVWGGAGRDRMEMARCSGIGKVESLSELGERIQKALGAGLKVHYLPPYQASSLFRTAELLAMDPGAVRPGASRPLTEEVAHQRSIKSDLEIAEIESALGVTDRMYRSAMATARPGLHEYDIAGAIQGLALRQNRQQSFIPIVTVRGEVLHNHAYDNLLQPGQLLLMDSGAESPNFYASDITRTFPVSGRFTTEQAGIYEVVLNMQLGAIAVMKPGLPFRDVHLRACAILVEGLRSLGLMKGSPEDAVEAGAHALFFPHGLGHMLGLDVHDMEDLGDVVGYPEGEERNTQFGLNFLRLTRPLETGFVVTVEPGIYFIPALMDQWRQENTHRDFINYEKLDSLRDFGGIRIEDDVLVTGNGARVLGPGIPKTLSEVESAMAQR